MVLCVAETALSAGTGVVGFMEASMSWRVKGEKEKNGEKED